ncbi:hypothetical protein GALMADRAFT_254903 [Galerina marginata CBS 339.88]|uniref:F-box domain-containing protein n=1 Tax=Galerina marginata (strain CBS 339.88) TaxID=685588 RepID=A0A067SHY1_GALM3|nr:hypothetical protein GALMADRAFT_254903 [Galerina marginata CBS 339.88]
MDNIVDLQARAPESLAHEDADILSLIFDINTEVPSIKDALKFTRISSQVCRAWRRTALDSTSIWGKLIDLDVLNKVADEWRAEVIKRSGDSPLWIKATAPMYDNEPRGKAGRIRQFGEHASRLPEVLFSLLEADWSRIEKLVVWADIAEIDARRWSAIYRPASRLRVFNLYGDFRSIGAISATPIFANHAPLLRDFRAGYMQLTRQLPSSSWLSNILSLCIMAPHTLSNTLNLLQNTPLLETLFVENVDWDNVNDMPPRLLQLPNLRVMNLVGHCNSYSVPIPLASIFCLHRGPIQLSIFAFAIFGHFLPDFLNSYWRVHKPTAIGLDIEDHSFYFHCKGTVDDSTLSIATHPNPFHLLVVFSLPAFTLYTVTELKLKCYDPLYLFAFGERLVSFLLLCSSVKVLITEEGILQYLPEAQLETSQTLLPMLQTIKLETWSGVSSGIIPFLTARIDIGHPVSVLDLTECQSEVALSALEGFAQIMGLTVLWRQQGLENVSEYQCGRGNSEALDFHISDE